MVKYQKFRGFGKVSDLLRWQNIHIPLVFFLGISSLLVAIFTSEGEVFYAKVIGFPLAVLFFFLSIYIYKIESIIAIREDGKIIIPSGVIGFNKYEDMSFNKYKDNSYGIQCLCWWPLLSITYFITFNINKNNIKKAYVVMEDEEKNIIRERKYLDISADVTTIERYWVDNAEKTICIQFKKPLIYNLTNSHEPPYKHLNKNKPLIDKIYVSVNKPEEVTKALN